ncbi:hypothetical protein KR50_18390 [Jeotgalibacillus campisalis]|uniref:Uncharacterized protein n=1 Tax=Jeotgalibacillus campisalis TaxID=220754 RepID=A0A0C2VFK3_9BACL|nr:hypothetical protein KR50_18390 [Jeotgalibacillus campisalis]
MSIYFRSGKRRLPAGYDSKLRPKPEEGSSSRPCGKRPPEAK